MTPRVQRILALHKAIIDDDEFIVEAQSAIDGAKAKIARMTEGIEITRTQRARRMRQIEALVAGEPEPAKDESKEEGPLRRLLRDDEDDDATGESPKPEPAPKEPAPPPRTFRGVYSVVQRTIAVLKASGGALDPSQVQAALARDGGREVAIETVRATLMRACKDRLIIRPRHGRYQWVEPSPQQPEIAALDDEEDA